MSVSAVLLTTIGAKSERKVQLSLSFWRAEVVAVGVDEPAVFPLAHRLIGLHQKSKYQCALFPCVYQ